METFGTIKNISGFRKWKSATVCYDDGKYLIVNNGESINLTDYLANVSFQNHSQTSVPGALARTALGGVAGMYLAKGRTGISGAVIGLGSSINTESQNTYVTLKFIDGDFIHGQTDPKTAALLENICNQSSGNDRIQNLQEQEKYVRLLDDAPRTYYEVKSELTLLETALKELGDLKANGSTFEQRDTAGQKYLQLQQKITDKKTLLEDLELRAKAIKAFGDFDTFLGQESSLRHKIDRLENSLENVKLFRKWHFWVLLISLFGWAIGSSETDPDPEVAAFYGTVLLLFMAYYFTRFTFRFLIKGSRKRRLIKLHAEYDEKYGMENITL